MIAERGVSLGTRDHSMESYKMYMVRREVTQKQNQVKNIIV